MHQLVAAYLGYEAPDEDEDDEPPVPSAADAQAQPVDPRRTPWMNGMGAIPAPEAMRNASTPMEGLAAAERLFFGELKEL